MTHLLVKQHSELHLTRSMKMPTSAMTLCYTVQLATEGRMSADRLCAKIAR